MTIKNLGFLFLLVSQDDAKTKEDVLTIADQMMYYAKARGRGRVCYAGDLLDKPGKLGA